MKKIITFLVALLFIAPTFAQFDTLRVKELYVGATGNQSRALRESDTIDFASTVWASSDIYRVSTILDTEPIISSTPLYAVSVIGNADIAGNRGRGIWLPILRNDTITKVGFSLQREDIGATFTNFNGILIYDSNNNLVAQSANDGTFWNTTGTKVLSLLSPLPVEAGTKIYVELVHSATGYTQGARYYSYTPTVKIFNEYIGGYRDGITDPPSSTISITLTSTYPIIWVK